MEPRIHLHVLSPATPDGASERLVVSAELEDERVRALEAALSYGLPEDPGMEPPVAWSLVRLDAEAVALVRAVRLPPAEPGASGRLTATSAVVPLAADLVGTGQILDFMEDRTLFPAARALPSAAATQPLPPARLRLTDAFGALLRLARGERAAIAALVAAATTIGEGGSPLRGIVVALPAAAFREDQEIVRALVGIAAAVPRRQRLALTFASYQDSPSTRPLSILAVPETHRCIARLQRSPGYFVFPGPPPATTHLAPRSADYATLAAGLLLAGRFEEVQALSATFDLHGVTSPESAQREIAEHAELLRVFQRPTAAAVLAWLDANPLPSDAERKRLLLDALARAIALEAEEGHHTAAAQLLRTLGVRWDDPAWTAGVGEHLRPAVTGFFRSWYTAAGWAPTTTLFGRLSGAGVWLRELLVVALADAIAEMVGVPGADEAAVLAILDAQFAALERAVPPVGYLQWRVRVVPEGDAQLGSLLGRMMAGPRPHEAIAAFLTTFESPDLPLFGELLATSVATLSATLPDAARELVATLVAHYGEDSDGLVALGVALGAVTGPHADDLRTRLVRRHVLPLAAPQPLYVDDFRRIIAHVAHALPRATWEDLIRQAAARAEENRDVLANLRRIWVALLAPPTRLPTNEVVRVLRALHTALPVLAHDSAPYAALALAGGPDAAAGLVLDDTLLLARAGEEEAAGRTLTGAFAALSRAATSGWAWQRALVAAALDPARAAADQALALFWLWSAGRAAGASDLAGHAARRLLLDNLLPLLEEPAMELLCRLLPSETSFTRERILLAAVEGALVRWSTRPTPALPPSIFRHFGAQAESLPRDAYRRIVARLGEACLLFRTPTAEDVRTFLDRVYVPRHWEPLAAVVQDLVRRQPSLRAHLAGLRRTTLGRRLPPQVLAAADEGPRPRIVE